MSLIEKDYELSGGKDYNSTLQPSSKLLWRTVNGVACLFFLLAAYVNLNDDDWYLWIFIYLSTAFFLLIETLDYQTLYDTFYYYCLNAFVFFLFIAYGCSLLIPSTPPTKQRNKSKEWFLHREEEREMSGLALASGWLLLIFCRRRHFYQSTYLLSIMAIVLTLVPIAMWSVCFVGDWSQYFPQCKDMFAVSFILYYLALYVLSDSQVFRLKYGLYNVENKHFLHINGPYIVVANHQSSIDFIGMMNIWTDDIKYCSVLAKKELLYAGPFGISAWLAGVEFVNRMNSEQAAKTMKNMMEKIKLKSLRLWIFPEGTRNMENEFRPFKSGAFRLAIQGQIPIVPVVFSSYKEIYNANKPNLFWKNGVVTIKCLKPIDTKNMTMGDFPQLTSTVREKMMKEFKALKTVPDV
ncbi:unnamed protein product [Didymodactylos carnosus]|uniref:1-acyl-sn-glycerol-3-phosphate acyltransferase n=1 Tax=Didymodactylos carnosus TaxID=1234261 RepID=A0A814FH00_9BILA|nr:unnamed protein product [Didymodactylos carnosus]CAF0985607.1 unnamed protein product [Didymodactylos carnosus]CAF3607024.1 unnamed protein product [Didymodactylos carnosus]CAF3757893.1 unnamed protein product [Didymodactylos carnosus]